MKKSKLWCILGIIGVSSTLFTGCDLFGKKKIEVANQSIQNQEVQEVIEVDGRVIAQETQGISLDFPATILQVLVKEGQVVEAGQPLMVLDMTSYLNQIQLKENELEIGKIKLASLEQTANPQVATLAQLKNTLNNQKSKLVDGTDEELKRLDNSLSLAKEAQQTAQEDYNAGKELAEVGGISQKELKSLEQILTAKIKQVEDIGLQIEQRGQAKADAIDDLAAQIKSMKTQLSNTDLSNEFQIAMATKEVQGLEILIKEMKGKINKDYLKENKIVATKDGQIVCNLVGEMGSQSMQANGPLFKLVDGKTLVIQVDIPEESSADVKIGQKLSITPFGSQTEAMTGTISTLSSQVIESYGENIVRAEVALDGELGNLRLGQSIEAEIIE